MSIERFQLACHHFIPVKYLPRDRKNDLEWFALMQHYGTPTRLLDFSASPFVASFFALADIYSKSDHACVWAFSLQELHEQNRNILGTDDACARAYKELPFNGVSPRRIVGYFYPERPGRRPFAQKGGFVYALDNEIDLESTFAQYDLSYGILLEFRIPRSKAIVIDALKDFKIMNISYSTLFGGLDAYARDIALDLFIVNS